MQDEAVKTISTLALAAESRVNEMLSQEVNGVLLAPESMKLHDLESMLENPRHFKGLMSTTSIDSFADYCEHHGKYQPVIFIDTESTPIQAVAVFDFGSIDAPDHARNKARLVLKDTPELAAIVAIKDRPLKQRELADFLEDWHHMLQCSAGEDVMHIGAAMAAVRNVTIQASAQATHVEGHFGASRSAMDAIEARSDVNRLPERITLTFVPHVGMPEITVHLRVSLKTGEEKPAFILRWIGEASQRKAIAETLQGIIAETVGHDGLFQGTFQR